MKIDDYIPVELFHEAKDFVYNIDCDVEIYKKIRQTTALKPCIEADKFVAYWFLEEYENYPHALITLYENKDEIDNSLPESDVMNVCEIMQLRMKKYYELLLENNMISGDICLPENNQIQTD